MAYKIRAAYQQDPNSLENTLEVVSTSYDTKEAALEFIKTNLELRTLKDDQDQVTLVIGDKTYIYFEVVSDTF